MSIVLQSSSGGSVTINEPTTASNFTQTLPAATGTVMVSGNMPAFSVYLGTNQSVTSGVVTKITLNTELFDTANCFDSTTNFRFTPNVAGYYLITVCFGINAATTFGTSSNLYIYKNGSSYSIISFGFNTYYSGTRSEVIYMNGTTDYLEMYGQIGGGSGVRFDGGSNLQTSMSGSLVRTA